MTRDISRYINFKVLSDTNFEALVGLTRQQSCDFMLAHRCPILPPRPMLPHTRMSTGGGACETEKFLAPLGQQWKSSNRVRCAVGEL